MKILLALSLLLLIYPINPKRPRTPKPFTAAWFDYQCRVKGAICPQRELPKCPDGRPYLGEEARRPANAACR